jgi:hypothetical protein
MKGRLLCCVFTAASAIWALPGGPLALAPNDPRFPDQWSLRNTGDNAGPLFAIAGADISAEAAWNLFTGSKDVIVAVSDTGWYYGGHVDLNANLLDEIVSTWVARPGDEDVINELSDEKYHHGTACASIIGAVGDNGIGMTGVNWNVSILPVRSSTSIYSRIQTIYDAADAGADIISCSWDIPWSASQEYLDALYDACVYAHEHDMLIVCSAGNDGRDIDEYPEYPCCYDFPNLICVTGARPDDTQIFNYGDQSVHLAAPGVRLLVVSGYEAYEYVAGTSFATPMVAGVAALVKGRFPELDAAGIKDRILRGVDRLPQLADKVITGGRLNAFKAIAEPDSVAPAAVADLRVYEAGYDWLLLQWTATGDDVNTGKAVAYDLRYATEPIDEAQFDDAEPIAAPPLPAAAGVRQKFKAAHLDSGQTYYFALKVLDEWGAYGEPGHVSGLSNIATGRTRSATDRSAPAGRLVGNAPNPFNPFTEIHFGLRLQARVEIRIFDARGRLITRIPAGSLAPGSHSVTWRGRDRGGRELSSGVYYAGLFLAGQRAGPVLKMCRVE